MFGLTDANDRQNTSHMSDRNSLPTNPYHPTCHSLRELVNAAGEVAERAGQLERFASSLRTSVERLGSRSAEAVVDLEAGLNRMTMLGRRVLERDAGTAADALRSVAQTLAAFDVPKLHQALAALAELAGELERKLPPHN
jgi:ABC-type transporter Mla subunit MlaD